jgi:hypothetical protein
MGDLGGFLEEFEKDQLYRKVFNPLMMFNNSIVLINPDKYGQEIRLSSRKSV